MTAALKDAVLVSKATFDTSIINIADHTTLRSYEGTHPTVFITALNSGIFAYDSTDVTSADDDINIIADNTGRRWKRQISNYSALANLNYDADNKTLSPTQKNMVITGAGAARSGCALGIVGARDNQELVLLGVTAFPVTLLNTNVRYAGGAASVTFGAATGNVQAMTLIYRAVDLAWYEVSRTTY